MSSAGRMQTVDSLLTISVPECKIVDRLLTIVSTGVYQVGSKFQFRKAIHVAAEIMVVNVLTDQRLAFVGKSLECDSMLIRSEGMEVI